MVNGFDAVMKITARVLAHTLAGTGVRSTTMSLIGCLLLDLPLAQAEINDFGVATPQQYQALQAVVRTDVVGLRQLGQALDRAVGNPGALTALVQHYAPAQGTVHFYTHRGPVSV